MYITPCTHHYLFKFSIQCFLVTLFWLSRSCQTSPAASAVEPDAPLAHDGLLVVAGDVMPADPVVVEVVEDRQAELAAVLAVVGLRVAVAGRWGKSSWRSLYFVREYLFIYLSTCTRARADINTHTHLSFTLPLPSFSLTHTHTTFLQILSPTALGNDTSSLTVMHSIILLDWLSTASTNGVFTYAPVCDQLMP